MADPKILIVEDEVIVAENIRRNLEKLGYSVPAMAFSGEESVEKVQEFNPDLVLMDIVLKGKMDGIEAAEEIRSRFNIPVVYLTAYSDDKTLLRAKISEPFGYILKPFNERELRTTIQIALHKHELETELKESRQWLLTTLKSIGDAVIATDSEGNIRFMNPVAEGLTKWEEKDALGKPFTDIFNIVSEKKRERVEDPVTTIFREGGVVELANETVLIAKDGSERFITDNGARIKDDRGGTMGAVIVFRDVTRQRKLEERLTRAEKLASLGLLASELAHKLRNPLTVIKSSTQFCMDEFSISDDVREILEVIRRNTEATDRIVYDLLNYAHPRKYEIDSHSIHRTVNKALHALQTDFSQQDIEVVKRYGRRIPKTEHDEERLVEVFINILLNSLQAIRAEGKIVVSTHHDAPKNRVEISIKDNGIGILKEHIAKVFDPFFSTRKTGTGLGLHICHQIVNEHHGSISINSKRNAGTTVTVTLPVVSNERE